MAGHIQDRWHVRPRPGTDRIRTARYGRTPRYRACFIDADGTRKSKTFHHRRDAERWLARTETAHLLKGHA
ncbi:hypothetical protein ACX6XY_28255 [Streptomyces sp. O3]